MNATPTLENVDSDSALQKEATSIPGPAKTVDNNVTPSPITNETATPTPYMDVDAPPTSRENSTDVPMSTEVHPSELLVERNASRRSSFL